MFSLLATCPTKYSLAIDVGPDRKMSDLGSSTPSSQRNANTQEYTPQSKTLTPLFSKDCIPPLLQSPGAVQRHSKSWVRPAVSWLFWTANKNKLAGIATWSKLQTVLCTLTVLNTVPGDLYGSFCPSKSMLALRHHHVSDTIRCRSECCCQLDAAMTMTIEDSSSSTH